MRRQGVGVLALVCAAVVAGCGSGSSGGTSGGASGGASGVVSPSSNETITVTSTAFSDGADIPVEFTCDGDEISPPLTWSDNAAKPAAWALVVDDPDAPGGTFVHWVVLDIPPDTRTLTAGEAPRGATQLTNSAGSSSYAGPCPPSGTHHYRFTVFALSAPTGLTADAGTDEALAKVRSTATEQGTLVGLYTRGS